MFVPDLPELKLNKSGELATGFAFQFKLLAKRNFLNMIRLPQTSYVKAMTTIATALFACLLFFQVPHTAEGIQNIQGALFFVCMNTVLNAVQNVILIFPEERPCFLREVNNNMYGPSPYFWAKITSELPFSLMQPVIFGSIVYFVIGLNSVNASFFFTFMLIVILTYNAAQGYALVISAGFSDKQLAVTLTPVLIIPFMLFAGFFASTSSIPIELVIFQYLSIFMYAYNALLLNQFEIFVNDPTGEYGNQGFPCITDNSCAPLSQITHSYTVTNSTGTFTESKHPDMWTMIGGLSAIYVIFYSSAWLILVLLAKKAE